MAGERGGVPILSKAGCLAGATSVFSLAMTKNATLVTHEPVQPNNWPTGHVRVELTGPEEVECVTIWIHGHTHYLHSTTARELAKMLGECLNEYNEIAQQHGVPTV